MEQFDAKFVTECRRSKMSWTAIGKHYKVSASTLSRWRQEKGFKEPLTIGTRDLILPLVEKFMRDQPWRGEQSLLQ